MNIRTLILSATLVVLLLVAMLLATARTGVISGPSGESASLPVGATRAKNQPDNR